MKSEQSESDSIGPARDLVEELRVFEYGAVLCIVLESPKVPMNGQIKVRESPADMYEAKHAEYGRLARKLADLKVDLDPLQAAVQVRAEEELLPEVKFVIICAGSNLGASRAILDVLEWYVKFE